LTAKYERGVGGRGKNYVSGCIESDSLNDAPVGFSFQPGVGTWAFEIVMTAAPNGPSRGNDVGWWASSHAWKSEIDFFEYFGFSRSDLSETYTIVCNAIYNTNLWSSSGETKGAILQSKVIPEMWDHRRPHRYTHVVYADMSMEMWVDGRLVLHRTRRPPSWSKEPMSLILSFSVKDWNKANAQFPKPFFTNSRSLHVRSIAVYHDGAHAGKGYSGGGIAPNTIVKGMKSQRRR